MSRKLSFYLYMWSVCLNTKVNAGDGLIDSPCILCSLCRSEVYYSSGSGFKKQQRNLRELCQKNNCFVVQKVELFKQAANEDSILSLEEFVTVLAMQQEK